MHMQYWQVVPVLASNTAQHEQTGKALRESNIYAVHVNAPD